jgi:hypothetical protein
MRSLSWSRPSGAGSPVGVTPPHHVFKETRMCFPPQHMVEAHPGGICGRLNNGVHSLLAAGSCPSSCVTCCRSAGSMRASVRRCVPLREPGHGRRSAVHGLTKGGTIRLREPADNPLLGNHQGTGGCTSSVCKVIAGGIKFHPPPKWGHVDRRWTTCSIAADHDSPRAWIMARRWVDPRNPHCS